MTLTMCHWLSALCAFITAGGMGKGEGKGATCGTCALLSCWPSPQAFCMPFFSTTLFIYNMTYRVAYNRVAVASL